MEVRVCPSCGTENKKSRSSCANCYASLATVPATQSAATAQPAAVPPPPARTLSGAPMQAPHPQPNLPTPPPAPPQSIPEPSGGSLAWVFILVGVLAAIVIVAFAGLKLRPLMQMANAEPKVPADQVVISFLDAKKTHDVAKVKPFLSETSIEMLNTALNSKQAQSAGFTREDAHKMVLWDLAPSPKQLETCDYTASVIKDEKAEKEGMRVVHVVLTAKPQATNQPQEMTNIMDSLSMVPEVDIVLVKEQAQWKVDLNETRRYNNKGGMLLLPK